MKYILIVFGLLVLSACSPKVQYVPVERATHDTLQIVKLKRDSVFQHDSVYIERSGDTLREWRWSVLNKYVFIHDTVYRSRTDSIPIPYAVEKQLTKWQQFKQRFGSFSYCFNIFAVAAICLLLLRIVKGK